MSATGLLLGLLNVAIYVAILLLVGAIAVWICGAIGLAIPDMVKKIYIIIVGLIALYMIASLLIGIPIGGLFHVSRVSALIAGVG
jgi:hypothetical protein